jgi:hypothetical protein
MKGRDGFSAERAGRQGSPLAEAAESQRRKRLLQGLLRQQVGTRLQEPRPRFLVRSILPGRGSNKMLLAVDMENNLPLSCSKFGPQRAGRIREG